VTPRKTARFADAALRCGTLAARLLGWRPTEFWSATPAELSNAIREPEDQSASGPDRVLIARMMERDANE